MIYISAQPDEVYFLWQLELQLYNFHSVGIGNESIHILVGYSPEKGIHPFFKEFTYSGAYPFTFRQLIRV